MADYISVAEFKTWARVESADADDDTFIGVLITYASRLIDRECQKRDSHFYNSGQAAAARYFPGSGNSEQWIDACTSVTTLETSDDFGTSWDTWTVSTDYWVSDGERFDLTPIRLLVANPNGSYLYFPKFIRGVRVTAVWGAYATAPAQIKEACYRIVNQEYHLKESAGNDDGMLVTDAGIWLPSGGIPKIVQRILNSYRSYT